MNNVEFPALIVDLKFLPLSSSENSLRKFNWTNVRILKSPEEIFNSALRHFSLKKMTEFKMNLEEFSFL